MNDADRARSGGEPCFGGESGDGDDSRQGDDSRSAAGACPFCGGRETELSNSFGSHASVSTWWCRACRSPFEVFKWGNHPDDE